jgi:hypothetical protein
MAKLVQRGAVVVDLVMERRLRRHHHEVRERRVIGFGPADPEICARRRDQLFGGTVYLAGRQSRRLGDQAFGQAIALRGVEDGEALEEWNGASLIFVPLALDLGNEAVGIEHCPPALALAHAPACGLRLPEGQPVLQGIAALDHGAPQDEDIDPRVARLVTALRGRPSAALALLHGRTHGNTPASSCSIIPAVTSS